MTWNFATLPAILPQIHFIASYPYRILFQSLTNRSIDPAISPGDFLQLDVERVQRSDFHDFDDFDVAFVAFGAGSLPGHGMQAAAPRCHRGWASMNRWQ